MDVWNAEKKNGFAVSNPPNSKTALLYASLGLN